MEKVVIDGYADFSGGMDSSRSPSLINQDQYAFASNIIVSENKDGLRTRCGFRCVEIQFANDFTREIFENGNHQGDGWYINDNGSVVIILVISGYFIEITNINKYIKYARVLNKDRQNNPDIKINHVSKIPGGCIVNDGESSAFLIKRNENRRTSHRNKEIGSGLMGVYVQNRFFYVLPNRKEIYASTIQNPTSLEEAYIDNIYGFKIPEDDKFITAIGRQATIARDISGGNLAFSTSDDFYSVDVRGARTAWGALAGKGVGFVTNTLPGLGAVSQSSFENFNGNIFYRNPVFGLVNLKQGVSEFVNRDTFSKQTIEASLFFDTDHKEFLDKCYTKSYGRSVLTTVSPFHKDGFVYWNGVLITTPDPYYGKDNNKYTNITESVFTGVRPWCIVVTKKNNKEEMFIFSYDKDGKNRLYLYDKDLKYDITYRGEKKRIESDIVTRFFTFGKPLNFKRGLGQYYSLDNIATDVDLTVSTRTSDSSKFDCQWSCSHLLGNKCIRGNKFCFDKNEEDSREFIKFSKDPSDLRYLKRQDFIKLKGSASLTKFVREAELQLSGTDIYDCKKEASRKPIEVKQPVEFKIFNYSI